MKSIKYLCSECHSIFKQKENEKNCPNCGKRLYKKDHLPTITALKKRTWSEFSRYIRLRDCLATTGNKDFGICYTCKKEYPYKSLQAGHMVAGRTNNILFDEKNVRAQCYSCNMHLNGNQGLFVINRIEDLMKEKYSLEDAFNEIKSAFYRDYKQYSYEELIALYEKYERMANELESQ